MSAPLVPREAAALGNGPRLAAATGSGTMVRAGGGSVAAFFALERVDRHGTALYALRVVNRTRQRLLCRVWAMVRHGEPVMAHAAPIEVAPLSTQRLQLPIRLDDFPGFERAALEVAGAELHSLVDGGPVKRRRPWRGYLAAAVASLFLGLVALAGAAGVRAELPRISALVLPPETLDGTTVRAQYETHGLGRLSYLVTAANGRRVAGGPLGGASGSIPVVVPAVAQDGPYTLQLVMSGALGTASDVRVLNVVHRRGRAPQIASLSVNPVVAQPGQTVVVAYSAVGSRGDVRLVDSEGVVWADKRFSKHGETRFVIPPVPGAKELRVLLRVARNGATAQSMAGIVVASPRVAEAGAETSAVGDDDPSAAPQSDAASNGTFAVLDRRVKGGEAIRVRILSPRNGMRIALTDGQSHEVAGVDVGAQADVVSLRAPRVAVTTTYTVVASFTDGFGEESVVEPVTVLP